MLRPVLTVLVALSLGCAGASSRPSPPPRSAASRAYDAKFPDPATPLDVKVLSTSDRSGASLVELTYAGATGTDPVRATLVRPPTGSKRGPAVLWVHWLGEPATTNRTEFLDEAVELAQQGAVSLLVDALWSQPGWYKQRTMDADVAGFTAQVVSLRRGLDLLAQEPGVDPSKLALVGHDFGGMTGMLASAADGRPRSHVLLALTPRFEQWMFYDPKKRPTDEQAYRQQLAAIDPIDALAALEGATLIQLAQEDFYVPPQQIEVWRKAISGRGELRTYATSHAMEAAQVRTDRQEWLHRTLGMAPVKSE
ncbi:MAG: alpha/beta hydrolase family protein [Myxococcaceae bacterium]